MTITEKINRFLGEGASSNLNVFDYIKKGNLSDFKVLLVALEKEWTEMKGAVDNNTSKQALTDAIYAIQHAKSKIDTVIRTETIQ